MTGEGLPEVPLSPLESDVGFAFFFGAAGARVRFFLRDFRVARVSAVTSELWLLRAGVRVRDKAGVVGVAGSKLVELVLFLGGGVRRVGLGRLRPSRVRTGGLGGAGSGLVGFTLFLLRMRCARLGRLDHVELLPEFG